MHTATMSLDALAERCADQTHRFMLHQANDPQYCFELMRRALTSDTAEAFTQIYRIYEPLMRQWVYKHSGFADTGEEADFFVQQAITNFYFRLRGDKFRDFKALNAVLQYLKMCIHSAIMQHLRAQKQVVQGLDEHDTAPGPRNDLQNHLQTREIWERIAALLPEERDLRLAYYAFSLWLKPMEIVEAYPAEWANARAVTVALYRIRRILRSDPTLRDLLGIRVERD